MSKFKVGDKVVPVSKSTPCSFENSFWGYAKKSNQPFLYVVDFIGSDIICDARAESSVGDFFLESDLIPYEESAIPEKPPVYYTLPAPSIDPDYKGFYEFIMRWDESAKCIECMANIFCKQHNWTCLEAIREYAENKYIKRNS